MFGYAVGVGRACSLASGGPLKACRMEPHSQQCPATHTPGAAGATRPPWEGCTDGAEPGYRRGPASGLGSPVCQQGLPGAQGASQREGRAAAARWRQSPRQPAASPPPPPWVARLKSSERDGDAASVPACSSSPRLGISRRKPFAMEGFKYIQKQIEKAIQFLLSLHPCPATLFPSKGKSHHCIC